MIIIGEKSEIGTLCFFDNDTGEKIGELDNIELLDLNLETMEESNDERVIKLPKQRTFSVTFDTEVLQILVYVQARKHRKKRINKKWLKRYGVKMVWIDVKRLED